MRIVFLNSGRDWGGAENWSRELCTGLADRGHDVTLVCHPRSELRSRLEGETRLGIVHAQMRGELNPIPLVQLTRVLRARNPNIVVAYRTRDIKLSVAASWLAGGLPVVHAHKAPYHLQDSAVYRFIWTRGVRAIAVPADAMRKLLLQEAPWLERKVIRVIPNGVDTMSYQPQPELRPEIRRELDIPDDVCLISYHGRIEQRKHVDVLIRAVAEAAADTAVHALIIGGGPQADELRRLAADLRAPVTFAGFRADIPRLLSAADAAAHLSTAEGMPNSVLEAMACGLPVIASDATSHTEQIDDGEQGYLVPPGSADGVAAAIRKLARAPSERSRMGRSARRRATERFSRRAMIDGYEGFFAEFAAKRED